MGDGQCHNIFCSFFPSLPPPPPSPAGNPFQSAAALKCRHSMHHSFPFDDRFHSSPLLRARVAVCVDRRKTLPRPPFFFLRPGPLPFLRCGKDARNHQVSVTFFFSFPCAAYSERENKSGGVVLFPFFLPSFSSCLPLLYSRND